MIDWWNLYVGVPFADLGRTRQGCDCWGLVRLVYQERLGIELPALLSYDTAEDREAVAEVVSDQKAEWQPVKQQRDFDVVVLDVLGLPCHVGVVVNDGKNFLHVMSGVNATIEKLDSMKWINRVESFWRYAA